MFSFLDKLKIHPKLRIVFNGHPALRAKSAPIAEITDDIRQLGRQLTSALLNSEVKGVGLAAPQVGINKRMIVLDTCPPGGRIRQDASPGELLLEPRMPLVLVNPEIIDHSITCETCNEGCLSLPGVSGDVTRPDCVVLKAQTLDGELITVECRGLLCRCLQHEIDHLDGKLFYDYLNDEDKKKASVVMKQLEKMEKAKLAKGTSDA